MSADGIYEKGCKCPDECAYHPTPNRPFTAPETPTELPSWADIQREVFATAKEKGWVKD